MTQNLVWAYFFNLIINSFLTFFTLVLLVQLIITILRIKHPRFKTLLLAIPFLKLALDPFFYDFQNWTLMHQINPLEAETGSRYLSFLVCYPTSLSFSFPFTTAIRLSLKDCQTFTIADLIFLSSNATLIKIIVLGIGLSSFFMIGIFLAKFVRSWKTLSYIIQNATPCERSVHNLHLSKQIEKRCKLIVSSHIDVPCAFRHHICFPTQLVHTLSQEEFEAIIAHELNHLKWYDSICRTICSFVSTLFWWIPANWWRKKLEQTQEIACDASIRHYSIHNSDLASAILKAVTKEKKPLMLATFFVQDSSLTTRIKALSENRVTKKIWLQICVGGFIALSLLFGKLWIF